MTQHFLPLCVAYLALVLTSAAPPPPEQAADVGFGIGGAHELTQCSEVKFDAVTSDDEGKTYHFTGSQYVRVDTKRCMHSFPISRTWPGVAGGVDAVFSYQDKMYLIKAGFTQPRSGAHYSLIEGYPKTLQEELGVQGPVDAAFTCPGDHTAHIIQGNQMRDVDLSATPRTVTEVTTPLRDKVDAALCGPDGVKLFVGNTYIRYRHVSQLRPPQPRQPGVDYIMASPEWYLITSTMTLCSTIQHSRPF